jgi:uncharacterized protein (DUF1778 family)
MKMATARFDMRLDEKIKAKAEKATALLGLKSLSEYIVKLIDDDATRVITKYEGITLENDIFDRFVIACEEAKKPNIALQEAAAFTREQGIK